MSTRIDYSCYCSQMMSAPLLKQTFHYYGEVQLWACEKIEKATTNVQNSLITCSTNIARTTTVQLMDQAVHIRNLSVFSLLQ